MTGDSRAVSCCCSVLTMMVASPGTTVTLQVLDVTQYTS